MDDKYINQLFKSIIDQDHAAVVVCNLEHQIMYMNPAAVANYVKWGGADLLGKDLMACHNPKSREMIHKVIDWFASDASHNSVFTHHGEKQNRDVYMVALRDDSGKLIGYYEKHEYRNLETAKPYEMN